MGIVTRRATLEKTWLTGLTASHAKKNRFGSELKSNGPCTTELRDHRRLCRFGRAVDFELHGRCAVWYYARCDGIGVDDARRDEKRWDGQRYSACPATKLKYSRIYGGGMKYAVLLLQANAGMSISEAKKLAENLYASAKGRNAHRSSMFDRTFWFGGSESFVFNKLGEILNSEKPRTSALGCGVMYALSKEYLPNEFGSDYMPSRINWIVQSSGVDHLDMLIVSIEYLIERYRIRARYLISVHDKLRYLVKEEDKYRAALTLICGRERCLYTYMLSMDDLPQGVAFFSAVDVTRRRS
ncbi:DNA polymerase family A-domain-containing protein [Amanita rubescens]|nr:DNA polymerase family A-domain-containing protein [Amanita rubescens]